MPPTATTSTGNGTPTAMPIDNTPTISSGFVGEEFINNLGSDLAPLLTLFGEQVTKQFLSMSLGWADHILLAVGPLGIITTMVSAIRVANVRVLKALIGRAREKLATAELELLSSTSNATSELWTEEGIVRQPGHAHILELVAYRSKTSEQDAKPEGIELEDNNNNNEVHIGDLGEACHQGVLKDADEDRSTILGDVFGKLGFRSTRPPRIPAEQLAKQPTNLILNVHRALPTSRDLWAFAVIGIAMQLVAVVIPAIMTYHWKQLKDAKPFQEYAYPTFLAGTCLLIVGIALCSYIIEATTVEQIFKPTGRHKVETVFRIQPECTMGDQPFQPYVIVNEPEDNWIRTSRYNPEEIHDYVDVQNILDNAPSRNVIGASVQDPPNDLDTHRTGRWWHNPKRIPRTFRQRSTETVKLSPKSRTKAQKPIVIVAILICLTGFICQFVGLRALHWSATITQLGITLIMTCIRAWIRIGISRKPGTFQLPSSDPNWIALSLGTACRSKWPPKDKPWPTTRPPVFRPYNDGQILDDMTTNIEPITTSDPRIELRLKLQSLSPQADLDLVPLTRSLVGTMQALFHHLYRYIISRKITWVHVVESSGTNDSVLHFARLELTMRNYRNRYGVIGTRPYLEEDVLHALLALWRYENTNSGRRTCVAKVFSRDDWKAKRGFLSAKTGADLYSSLSKVTYSVPRHNGRGMVVERYIGENESFTGLSIENMQDSTASSGTGENSLYGYLTVDMPNKTSDYAFELCAGFLDALCQEVNLEFDYKTKNWYTKSGESALVLDIDSIVKSLMAEKMFRTVMEAKLLVVASFARCTVWKDPQGQAVPASTPDLPTPGASTTAQAEESPQTGPVAPEDSKHQPTSTPPNTPITSASAAVEAGGSAPTKVVPLEATENEAQDS